MASDSITAAGRRRSSAPFPKMFVPFITILPGMIAAVLVTEIADLKAGGLPVGAGRGRGPTTTRCS